MESKREEDAPVLKWIGTIRLFILNFRSAGAAK
jgi:hypothetical protein